MTHDPMLELRIRQRILALVREFPGLHLREVARQLDTSVALVEYHIPLMETNGVLRTEKDQRYIRIYPIVDGTSLDALDRRQLAVLRQEIPLQLCLRLLDSPGPMRHGALADELGIGKSKLSFHLRKLMDAGIALKEADGAFLLANRKATADLLLTYRPTADLRDRFSDLWTSFYSR